MAKKSSKGKKPIATKNADVTQIDADGGERRLAERREVHISIVPPDKLKKYEQALRGTGKALVGEFTKNSQHRRWQQWVSRVVAFVAFVIVVAIIGYFFQGGYSPWIILLSLGLFLNFLHKN